MRNAYLDMVANHVVAESTNLLATTRGAHIFSVKAHKNIDNGKLVDLGAMSCITSKTAAGVTTKFYSREYFEITSDPTDASHIGLILSTPVGPDERPAKLVEEKCFYNAEGELMRVYDLCFGDRFTISENGINNTPEVGKFVVADGEDLSATAGPVPTTTAFYGEIIDKIVRNRETFYEILVRKNA